MTCEILFSHNLDGNSDTHYSMKNIEDVMLSETSWSWKDKCYMIPLMILQVEESNSEGWKVYGGCQGWQGGTGELVSHRDRISVLQNE